MTKTNQNLKNDGNQKNILADKANFSFDFGLILAILRRSLSLRIVFSHITTATSCQDADFFPGMTHTYKLVRLLTLASAGLNSIFDVFFYFFLYTP